MPTPITDLSTPVHLRDNNAAATMEAPPPDTQAFPLNEPGGMPFNTSTNSAQKIANLAGIISFLKVDDATHLRYKPNGNTFCNIYAYDLSCLAGRRINQYFIPRVWWTDDAAARIQAGQPQIPALGITLREMTANDLHDWFEKFGGNFGWVVQNDLTAMQNFVNATGDIGVLVGKKAVGHGHITIVVPEAAAGGHGAAVRNAAGKVTNPLQSQAGNNNIEFGQATIGGQPWFTTGGHDSAFYIFRLSN